MGVFEGRVLRKILGPAREEVTGEWRKLLIEEFNNLCPQNIRITDLNGERGLGSMHGRDDKWIRSHKSRRQETIWKTQK